jgi:hypothetical protein
MKRFVKFAEGEKNTLKFATYTKLENIQSPITFNQIYQSCRVKHEKVCKICRRRKKHPQICQLNQA